MIRKHGTLQALAMMLVCAASANAGDNSAEIKRSLQQRFPEAPIDEVRVSARIPGMYEVFVQDSVAFTDTTGERLFVGQVLDVTSRKDIGAQILDERNRIDFASLPLDRAIRTVRGDGRRKLAVFADPDCPFCHELEQTLAGITDVTIYTFLYPLAELHPEAPAKARALWCAPDRAAAWADWMLRNVAPPPRECPVDALEQVLALGMQLKIRSTPMLYLADGSRINGVVPGKQLEALLGAASGKAAPAR